MIQSQRDASFCVTRRQSDDERKTIQQQTKTNDTPKGNLKLNRQTEDRKEIKMRCDYVRFSFQSGVCAHI